MKIISVKRLPLGLIGAFLMALVSPIWALTAIEVAKLTASDGAWFGRPVAVDGDTVLVSGTNVGESGAVYVFTLRSGVWTEQAKLTASDAADNRYFGQSVAVDGNTALIGASGSVYVFTRNAGMWAEQAKLTGPFGRSVALDGNTALLGTYVFIRNAGVWTEQAKLTAGDAASYSNFGTSFAVDGDTALIGWRESAYVFTRNAGVWTEEAKLTASDAAVKYIYFGSSVAVEGDTALVGAPSNQSHAAVYVFTRRSGAWAEQAKLTASDAASYSYFGTSVAVEGDTALVGTSPWHPNGSAYVFTRNSGAWAEQAKLTPIDATSGDKFGWSVALDGHTALISASGIGYTYVFSLIAGAVVTIDVIPGNEPNIINLSSADFIPVAVLTDGEFDSLQVDPNTVRFGPAKAIAERYEVVDVDSDGDLDLLFYYSIKHTNIACSDRRATLVGELYSGSEITGTDAIWTVACAIKRDIEAESMALSAGYAVEDNLAASRGRLIRRRSSAGNPATANTKFAGPVGSYDITVSYFDENDGRSNLAFLWNGQMLDQWTADEDPSCSDCASPVASTLTARTVATGIRLAPDDELTLQGTGEHYEYARFDKITLSSFDFHTLEAELMTLGKGYAVEANAAASGGQLIRRVTASAKPATASTQYEGPEGIYDIAVSYFDENDGRSSLAFFFNGAMLDQWIADEEAVCSKCDSPGKSTLRTRTVATGIRLQPGDELTLQGTGEPYEYARFDKIDLTRVVAP